MTEINQFIINAQHKIADIATKIVTDGDCAELDAALQLSNFIEELTCTYYNVGEDETLVIIHHLNRLAELSKIPLLAIPEYGTSIVLGDTVFSYNITGGGAPAVHTHAIGDVTGLQVALNDRYTKGEITTVLQTALDSRDWKQSVSTFASLATTYPTPAVGWTATVNNENTVYRWSGTAWVNIGSSSNTPLATPSIDGLMSKTDKTKLDGLGGEQLFTFSIPVSLSGGKTLGKYATGTTASFVDKTIAQILTDIGQEALEPSASLSLSLGQQEYNQLNVSPNLTWTYTINTLGATLSNFKLERSRDGVTWALLHNASTPPVSPFSGGTLNPTTPDNSTIQYRLTVTDSAGASKAVVSTVPFKAYQQPSISFGIGTTSRKRGNISTSISGTVTRNSPNIALTNYQLQFSANGGAWTNIGTAVTGTTSSITIPATTHNDVSLVNSNTISYRVLVVDAQQTTTSGSQGVTFSNTSYFGYRLTDPTSITNLEALGNESLTESKARLVSGVTATGGNYVYYTYQAGAGDLTGCIMDGAAPVFGAFSKLADITGTNSHGATITMRIYRSNSTDAFTNNSLNFS